MSNVAKERPPDLRYAAEVISMMDEVTNELYEIWQNLSVDRALDKGRMKVVASDAEDTLQDAVKKMLEGVHAKTTTAKGTS